MTLKCIIFGNLYHALKNIDFLYHVVVLWLVYCLISTTAFEEVHVMAMAQLEWLSKYEETPEHTTINQAQV